MSDQEFVDQVAEAITKALRQVSDVVGVAGSPISSTERTNCE